MGVNHNGDLKLAKKLIIAAKKVGANAVKFQIFQLINWLARNSKKLLSKKKTKKKQHQMLKKLELRIENYYELKKLCEK